MKATEDATGSFFSRDEKTLVLFTHFGIAVAHFVEIVQPEREVYWVFDFINNGARYRRERSVGDPPQRDILLHLRAFVLDVINQVEGVEQCRET